MDDKFRSFGIGAGVGARLTGSLFFFAEVKRVRYGKETIDSGTTAFGETFEDEAKLTSTIGTRGLAYRWWD